VILALAGALGTVFLQEFLDDRVSSPEELERLVPLRTLAHVAGLSPSMGDWHRLFSGTLGR